MCHNYSIKQKTKTTQQQHELILGLMSEQDFMNIFGMTKAPEKKSSPKKVVRRVSDSKLEVKSDDEASQWRNLYNTDHAADTKHTQIKKGPQKKKNNSAPSRMLTRVVEDASNESSGSSSEDIKPYKAHSKNPMYRAVAFFKT